MIQASDEATPGDSTARQVAPNALIVGPMKAGTSWLYEYLKTRGDVALPDGVKETFFFDQRFDTKGTDWYLSHFRNSDRDQIKRVMEVAPTYFRSDLAPERIHQTLGLIQIVVTLRDPAERAFSLFNHMKRYGFTRCETFRDAVDQHAEILQSSRYATCLRRWDTTFGAGRVSVLLMEDLKSDPRLFASRCCQALGLDPPSANTPLPDPVNVASQPRNYLVARAGRMAGDTLRSLRLYWAVEAAKKAGLKQLFFGKPQTVRTKISIDDRRWFIGLIRDDIQKLQSRIQRDVTPWLDCDSTT